MRRLGGFFLLVLLASPAEAGRWLDSIRNAEGGGLQFYDDRIANSRIAVTAAPLLLPLGLTKAKAEMTLGNRASFSVSLAGGSWLWQGGVLGAGAQFLVYPTGRFHGGTQLGISALQLLELDAGLKALPEKVLSGHDFLLLGGVVGWKKTTKDGKVLEIQIGINQLREDGQPHNDYPWLPTLGFNYGWAL
tara:strand:- start:54 stop:623 length:570 start_codon:yes stop_codon:yes gene_type:complete